VGDGSNAEARLGATGSRLAPVVHLRPFLPQLSEGETVSTNSGERLQIYDNFDKQGYTLADYAVKWFTPFGWGEMEVNETRNFRDGYVKQIERLPSTVTGNPPNQDCPQAAEVGTD
jgi:hypothetical protein